MSTPTTNDLVLIKLPLHEGQAPVDVLVLTNSVHDHADGEISLLMSEADEPAIVRSYVGFSEMPSLYSPRELGSLSAYMSHHVDEVDALVLAGAAAHGNLTLARAVYGMSVKKLDAAEALEDAVAVDHDICLMHRRQLAIARAAEMY